MSLLTFGYGDVQLYVDLIEAAVVSRREEFVDLVGECVARQMFVEGQASTRRCCCGRHCVILRIFFHFSNLDFEFNLF